MKRRCLGLGLSIVLIISLIGCRGRSEPIPSLAENDKPLFVLGEDPDHSYKSIFACYYVDRAGRAYIWDFYRPEGIDVYDSNGKFEFHFGKRGQGPAEFPALSAIAVDIQGNVWASGGDRLTLKTFSPRGEYQKDVMLPPDIARSFVLKMEFSDDGLLYFMCRRPNGDICFYQFDSGGEVFSLIQCNSHRTGISLTNFMPDFDIDAEGNICITDSFDYAVLKYSKEGKLLKKFRLDDFSKERINKNDFNIFLDESFKIILYPRYKEMLAELTGPSRFFPAVFGINIDQGRIYIWTSKRDALSRYLVDIYDMEFRPIGRACYFNWVRQNLARIRNGRLYIPSIENTNVQLTKRVGRLGLLNISDKLNVYSVALKFFACAGRGGAEFFKPNHAKRVARLLEIKSEISFCLTPSF